MIWVFVELNNKRSWGCWAVVGKRDGAHIVATRLPFVANTWLCPYGDITETSPSCRIIPPVPSSCLWCWGLPSVIVQRWAGEPCFVPRVSILCAGGYGAGRETIGQNGPNVLKESSFFNQELTHMHHKGKTAQNPILRPPLHRDSFRSLPAAATFLFVHMWKSGSRWLCERCFFFFSLYSSAFFFIVFFILFYFFLSPLSL